MSEQLKQAAQQALEALGYGVAWKEGGHQKARAAIDALGAALTTSKPAQATPDVPETDFGNKATPEPVGEVVYQYQIANGSWIDQTKESHDYNVKRGQATVRVLYTHPAPGVPEIDYQALIHAAWGKHKYAQGTGGCIAFKRGAEWFRDIALAAAQANGVDPEDLAAAGVMLTGRKSDHA